MASLFIKDSGTAARVDRMARRLGVTKTDTVNRALAALEERLGPEERTQPCLAERMAVWRKANPLPPRVRGSDKAFSDWLSGEEDVEDIR